MRNPISIDPYVEIHTIRGPYGLVVTLDSSDIYPDDPGMGTPMLVERKGETMTLHCANYNVGELFSESTGGAVIDDAYSWIASFYDAACEWETYHLDRIRREKA